VTTPNSPLTYPGECDSGELTFGRDGSEADDLGTLEAALNAQTIIPIPHLNGRTSFPCDIKCPSSGLSTNMAVPNISQVLPGAHVYIVLKADQSTGRTVSGTVGQVLTRGNHPRGIKVRLADGRVGRVQRMGDDASPAVLARVEEPHRQREGGWGVMGRDEVLPQESVGLDAYIKPGRKQKQRGGRTGRGTAEGDVRDDDPSERSVQQPPVPTTDTVKCPVCGDFEGDEAAVAHHVAAHFDS